MSRSTTWLALSLTLLLGAGGFAALGSAKEAALSSGPFWTEGDSAPAPGRPDSFADLADRLSAAVVFIEVERPAPQQSMFGPHELPFPFRTPEEGEAPKEQQQPQRRPRTAPASGSGFVISPDGYIVTNDHVIEEAVKISVRLLDGSEIPGKVIGRDQKTDLALIKVDAPKPLPVAPLGDSDKLRVGDWVVAIGNPFGLDHSVTVGILSAKGRSLQQSQYDDFLQTDASINPGNSGGPLIDTAGRVIGINSAIRANPMGGGTGIGFAIPINLAKALLPQLKEKGSVTRGWLGVSIQRVTPTLARGFKLQEPRGALVGDIFPDSPAAGKIERGDVIVEFNGSSIATVDDLPKRVAETSPGTKVDIVLIRNGQKKNVKTTIERRTEDEQPPQEAKIEPKESTASSYPNWGFEAEDLTPSLASRLGLESGDGGVVVTEVESDSPADRADLKPGDVILEINRKSIRSAKDLDKGLEVDAPFLLIRRSDPSGREQTFYRELERE
jgi:serine protease Do